MSKHNSKFGKGLHSASELIGLEQRIMLDAAAPVAMDQLEQQLESSATQASESEDHPIKMYSAANDSRRHEIIFIDSSIETYQSLLDDVLANADDVYWSDTDDNRLNQITIVSGDKLIEVYAVDGSKQGFDAVTQALTSKQNLDAVHILSHGGDAKISMGADTIEAGNIESFSNSLAIWGDALNDEGDILLYGCNVGKDAAGGEFVKAFARYSNADIAASDDLTGASSLGGDWQLEVSSGALQTELVVGEQAAASFAGLLIQEPPLPNAVLDLPNEEFLGESFSFTATFNNAATDADSDGSVGIGYAPYMSVLLEPGAVINSATYLGNALNLANQFTWDATESEWRDANGDPLTDHPFGSSPDFDVPADPGVDGAQWFLIELPFGSFTSDQPAAPIEFNATLDPAAGAVVGSPISITTQGGFRYGADPLNNPSTDTPLLQAAASSDTITPSLLQIEKHVSSAVNNSAGSESEAATGPSNPITWRVEVDIADGETVENVVITDFVPNDFYYTGGLSVSGAASGSFVNLNSADALAGAVNGNTLTVSMDEVVGTSSTNDIVITYTGYIPELDANNQAIIDPVTGALQAGGGQIVNSAQIEADYDNGTELTAVPLDTASRTIAPETVAIQKTAANVNDTNALGNSPGDTLEWTLRVQVSDYFSADDFILTDVLSDGQTFDSSFTPTVQVLEQGVDSGTLAFAAPHFTVNPIDSSTGLTTIDFRLSDQLGGDGVLDGDLSVDAITNGQTTVEIKFRTIIEEEFDHPEYLSGDASVDVADIISNSVTVSAEIVGTDNIVSDGSTAAVQISGPSQSKSIYAVDGDTEFGDARLEPGGTVTYRITVDLPSSDIENLTITDYLPLPVFEVSTAFSYGGLFTGSDNVPAVGEYGFGPSTDSSDFPADFFNGASPSFGVTVTADSAGNKMTFDFGSIDVNDSNGGTIDLLFTVAAVDAAFADGLALTNQATVGYDNSNNPQPAATEIIQIELNAPELLISKGVVALDSSSNGSFDEALSSAGVSFTDAGTMGAPFSGTITSAAIAAEPVTSDVLDVDAGDTVRFALVVENQGGGDAYDIILKDSLPAGYSFAGNLTVTLGDGTAVDMSGTTASDLFTAGGISLPDSAAAGVLGEGRDGSTATTDGSNIIVLTYDATLQSGANSNEVLTNTAEILAFAGFEAGFDYTAGSTDSKWQDDSETTIREASISKQIHSSAIQNADNDLLEASIGEFVQYQLVIDVPEGEMPLSEIVDTLDPGLVFVSVDSVTPSSASVSNSALSSPSAGATGAINFGLGTISNSNTDNAVTETLTILYTVRVANDANASNGAELSNNVVLLWDVDGNAANDDAEDGSVVDSDGSIANNTVSVVEASLEASKTMTTTPDDEGDAIAYEIVLSHDSNSTTSAYDVTFSDLLPAGISGVTVSATHSTNGDIGPSGVSPIIAFNAVTGEVETTGAGSFDLLEGETVTITVSGSLGTAVAGELISNSASVNWSSLDSAVATDGDESNERGGNTSGLADGSDGYTDTGSVSFRVDDAEIQKSVLGTTINNTENTNSEAVVGEYIRYQLQITVPEGSMPLTEIADILDAGLAFVSLDSVTPSANVSTGVVSGPTAGDTGTLTFDLGTVSNSNNDNAVADTVTIEYTVQVLDDAANVNRDDTLGNTVLLRWDADDNGSNTDAEDRSASDSDGDPENNVTIIEPELQATKSITTTPADEADAVVYQVVIAHTAASNSTAFDTTFSDLVPVGISVSSVSAVHSNASIGDISGSFQQVTNTVSTLSGSSFDLLEGETVTVTITGSLTDINAGETVANTANIEWTSLNAGVDNGDHANERDSTSGVSYSDTSNSAEFTATPVTLTKNVVSTSIIEGDNGNLDATIGEYINYQIVATLPEGSAPLAIIEDTLDDGLVFDAANGITVTRSSADLSTDLSGDPGDFSTVSAALSGQTISIDLGNIDNSNTDNSLSETITIEYRAYVANDASSQPAGVHRGDSLGNSVEFRWDVNDDGSNLDGSALDGDGDAANNITVVEADLQSVKTITTTPLDQGDTVVYQIVLSHTAISNSAAYDVRVNDLVDSGITISSVEATHSSAGPLGDSGSGLISANGNSVETASGMGFDLLEGETLTIEITGTTSGVVVGSTVGNTATVNWSSLSQSVADGNDATERGGDNGGMADGSEGYTDTSSTVEFTVNSATLSKQLVSTGINNANNDDAEAVIGEYVQYRIVMGVPEGSMPLAEIVDTLDAGLEFVRIDSVIPSNAADITTDLAGGFAAVNGPAAGTAGTFTLDLGSLTNTNNDDGAAETLTILYTVRVANDLSNATAGDILDNSAELRWDADSNGSNTNAGDGSASDADGALNNQITVLEASPAVLKSVNESDPFLGETISYTVVLSNPSSATGTDAYDLTLSDSLPSELTLDPSSIRLDGQLLASHSNVVSSSTGANGFSIQLASLSLDSSSTLTYDATVSADTADFGATPQNTASLQWSSLDSTVVDDGDETLERGGDASGLADGSDGYVHTESETVTLSAPDLSLAKSDGGASVAAEGIVVYNLSYANNGSRDAIGVVITETVPVGASFDLVNSTAGWTEIAPGSGVFTFAVGTVAQAAAGSVDFAISADSTFVAGFSELSNTASIADDGSQGPDADASDNSATDTTTVNAAPDLALSKDDAGVSTAPDGSVVYTLSYANNGTQDATGVVITETVPSGASFDASNSTVGWAETAPGSGVFTFAVGNLATGASGDTDFAVMADSTFVAGQDELANTATINDDNSNGADSDANDNTATDTTSVDAAPDMTVAVDDGGMSTLPNGTVVYTLSYANNGSQGATGVVLTQTLPEGSSFDAANSSAGWAETAPGSGVYTLSVANVDAGDGSSVNFAVTADSNFVAGLHELATTASIADDGSNGSDENPADNTDTDTTPIIAAPNLALSKDDGGVSVLPNGSVVYTLNYANNGNQDATGVVITESLPNGSLFDAGNSSAGWVETAPGSGVFSFNVGPLAVAASGSIDFAVLADATFAAGQHQLANTASIADDGNNGSDSDPSDNSAVDTTSIVAAPDLSVGVDDSGVTATPDGIVVYAINYANNGPQGATGVVLSQTVPVGSSFDAAASSPGWVETAPGSGVYTLDLGLLNSGQAGSVDFAVQADSTFVAGHHELLDAVTIADDGNNGADENAQDNSDSETTPIAAAPDYRVVKSSDNGSADLFPGQPVTYTVTVFNDGTQDGTGLLVTDAWPSFVFEVPSSISNGGSYDSLSEQITWNIAPLAAGSSIDLTVEAQVLPTLQAGISEVTNSATASDDGSNGADATPGNNTGSDTDSIESAVPDYRVLISSDNPAELVPGQVVSYTIEIFNDGLQDGTGIVVTNPFPIEVFENPSAISGGGVFDASNGEIEWNFSDFAAGESMVLTVTATVKDVIPAGFDDVVNSASISDDGNNGPDPIDNNTATDVDPLIAAPEYLVTVDSDTDGELSVGETASYTVDFTNLGSQDGTGVVISVQVPDGVFFDPESISNGGVYDPVSGIISWQVGDLDVGEQGQFTFQATVQDAVEAGFHEGLVIATLVDDGENGESEFPENSTDSHVTPVEAAPDYVVSIDDNIDFVPRNVDVTYHMTVANQGTQDGTGVVVVVNFDPSILHIQDADGGLVDEVAGTISWTFESMPVGENQHFDVVAQVRPTAVIDNAEQLFGPSAHVTDDMGNGEDLDLSNNQADAKTTLLSDVGDLDYMLNGNDTEHALHYAQDAARQFDYYSYPGWLHGRLISLETMQADANLIAARNEAAFDNSFGLWNHGYFPNPWNHERGDAVETKELLFAGSKATRLNLQAEWFADSYDELRFNSDWQDGFDLEIAPDTSLAQASGQDSWALKMFEDALDNAERELNEKQLGSADEFGSDQFRDAPAVMSGDAANELLKVFKNAASDDE